MNVKLASAVGACALAMAGAANATIAIDATAPYPANPDETIQLKSGSGSTTVVGETNQTHTLVNFVGSENLLSPSNGQARIEGSDGAFSYLEISAADPTVGFSALELNLDAAANGGVQFTAFDQNNNPFLFDETLGQNGSNRFSFIASDDQLIRRLVLSSSVQLADVSQVRVTTASLPGGPGGPGPVPEPATWAMMLLGFFGAGSLLRGRQRGLSAPAA